MTHTDTTSLFGRALAASMSVAGERPRVGTSTIARAQAPAARAASTTVSYAATAVATNPWLGGSGSGEGMGNCPTSFVDHSTKRIHPGRLEGMT
ncbi:MAG: hypothetical protein ABJ382_11055 [Ilumatobacter sp.]